MATSKKNPATYQGAPGSLQQNAKAPLNRRKGEPDTRVHSHSRVSGGGGEEGFHHTHDPDEKGGLKHQKSKHGQ